MKGYVTGLGLSLLFGVAGAASAVTATLDFGDATKTVDAAQVTSPADGKTTATTRANITGVQTAGFLYIDVKDDLFKSSAALWVRVDFFDEGNDQFQLEYNGDDVDAATGDKAENTNKVANPQSKQKFDTKVWANQTFKLPNFRLFNGMDGKADLRIDDLGDGQEIISKITLTDQDPEKVHFPRNNPDKPITIDGKISEGEWDGAYTFTMGKAEFDAINGTNWTGAEDFTGTYFVKWDEAAYYMRGDITDDAPLVNETADAAGCYCSGDGVEIYLGLDNSNPNRNKYLPATDFQVITAIGAERPRAAIHHGDNGIATLDLGEVPVADMVVVKTDRGYQFEYRIPWTKLSAETKVVAGQNISWNMFGNDGDDASSQQTAMSPFKRKNMWVDPSGWTATVLEPILKVENP